MRDASCRRPAVPRHTTHKSTVRIRYPWHPLVDTELRVTGCRDRGGQASYVVTLPDGTKTEVPVWMTEADAALNCTAVERPVVSVSALEALRRLFDASDLLDDPPVVRSPPSAGGS